MADEATMITAKRDTEIIACSARWIASMFQDQFTLGEMLLACGRAAGLALGAVPAADRTRLLLSIITVADATAQDAAADGKLNGFRHFGPGD